MARCSGFFVHRRGHYKKLFFLNKSSGFTLVELLITISLMAFVGATLIAVLGAGLRVWKRISNYGVQDQNALIAYEQVRKDLNNVRTFSLIPFEGGYNEFSFASTNYPDGNSNLPMELGQTHYFLDRANNRLCRSFVSYRSSRQFRNKKPCQSLFEDVERVRFKYFGGSKGGWASRWESEDLPMSVSISVTVQREGEKRSVHAFIANLPNATISGS